MSRLNRSAVICAIAGAALVPTTASAQSTEAALAKEQYYESIGAGDTAALAYEQYLQSFGAPAPLDPPEPATSGDDLPWLPIALSIGGGVVAVGVGATQRRRVRLRRRRTVGTAA
jgi:hypothetical protein